MELNNKLYRTEDIELLEGFKNLGDVQTGLALSKQERKMNEIQLEANLRNIKMSEDLKKSTDLYSIILISLTAILAIIGVVQLVVDVESSNHFWTDIGLIVIMFFAIWFIGEKLQKELTIRFGSNENKR